MKTTDAKLIEAYRHNEAEMNRVIAGRGSVAVIMADPIWKAARELDSALYSEIKRRGLLEHLTGVTK